MFRSRRCRRPTHKVLLEPLQFGAGLHVEGEMVHFLRSRRRRVVRGRPEIGDDRRVGSVGHLRRLVEREQLSVTQFEEDLSVGVSPSGPAVRVPDIRATSSCCATAEGENFLRPDNLQAENVTIEADTLCHIVREQDDMVDPFYLALGTAGGITCREIGSLPATMGLCPLLPQPRRRPPPVAGPPSTRADALSTRSDPCSILALGRERSPRRDKPSRSKGAGE